LSGNGAALNLARLFLLVRWVTCGIAALATEPRQTGVAFLLARDRNRTMLSPTPLPTKLDALAGKTILIVDDSEIAREGLAAVLEREGAKPVQAANGMEALAYLEAAQAPPHLILLDMLLPIMDGWQFMEKRRSTPRLASIPVVMVTALGAASWKWASSLGAVGLIRKPIEVEQLVRTIKYCCREDTAH